MTFRMQLDYDRRIPVYRQIIEAVRAAIVNGSLTGGEQLPTIHALARELDINPNTVVRAYRELEHQGQLATVRGRGTFVKDDRVIEAATRHKLLQQFVADTLQRASERGIGRDELIEYLTRRGDQP